MTTPWDQLAQTEGIDLGPVAKNLLMGGASADVIVAAVPPSEWMSLALGLLSLEGPSDPATGLVGDEDQIKTLLDALFAAGLDINTVEGPYKQTKPQYDGNLLGYAALDLRPRLVRYLLRRGAYPDVDRASALYWVTGEVLEQAMEEKYADILRRGRAIVSSLLRAGLSPSLLHPEQVTLFFGGEGLWSLLPLPSTAWARLRLLPVDRRDLHVAKAALAAVLPPNLVRYLGVAL